MNGKRFLNSEIILSGFWRIVRSSSNHLFPWWEALTDSKESDSKESDKNLSTIVSLDSRLSDHTNKINNINQNVSTIQTQQNENTNYIKYLQTQILKFENEVSK